MATRRAQALLRLVVIVVLVGGVAGVGLWTLLHFSRPLVTVTEVVSAPVVEAFYATGTLQPEREHPVKSNLEGLVTQVLVEKGQAVRKGQRLVFVTADDLQFRFLQAQADRALKAALGDEATSPVLRDLDARIKVAGDQLEIAQRDLKRSRDLLASNAASQADVDRAADREATILRDVELLRGQRQTRQLELKRDMAVADAALEIAQWNLDQQTIISPIDGVVLDQPVSTGTRVHVNESLMRIADVAPASLVMRAQVDEEDRVRVQAVASAGGAVTTGPSTAPADGQAVRIVLYSFPNRQFLGRVKRVYPMADPVRRTFEVDVVMTPPDPRFAAGMTGELAFITAEVAKALVVPSQSVQAGEVWLVRDGRLEKRQVQVGIRSVERVEVVAGLDAGDTVVISPAGSLKPAQPVRTRAMDPAAAAGLNKKPAEESTFRGFN